MRDGDGDEGGSVVGRLGLKVSKGVAPVMAMIFMKGCEDMNCS